MPRKLRIEYPSSMCHLLSRGNRRETTLPIKAIARRLHFRTSKSTNVRLHEVMRASAPADAAKGGLQM